MVFQIENKLGRILSIKTQKQSMWVERKGHGFYLCIIYEDLFIVHNTINFQ